MKLTVDIPNDLIAQKIIFFLSCLKNEGVKFKEERDTKVIAVSKVNNTSQENTKIAPSNTYQDLLEMEQQLSCHALIKMILEDMPEDFIYKASEKTDTEIWYEERSHQYE
jgi:hypothetical protein